ncbi:MAG: hypothetical protein CME69_03920 [Halobacteriovorax sp.]|nr:hypothetical protein [Halobacteriovorax sp.]MEE3079142.1 helix-turn-helix transcriptional regulator [Bdellovibrionota bacterium]
MTENYESVHVYSYVRRCIIKIRYMRHIRGFTQTEFAKAINVSKRNYQRIEALEAIPSLDMMYKIAKTLEVDFDYLYSPKLVTDELYDTKFFSSQEEFATIDKVANSNFLNLMNSEEVKTVVESASLEDILNVEEFMNDSNGLFICDYNTMYLNNALKTFTNRSTHKQSTHIGWKDLQRFSLLLDALYTYNPAYMHFTHKAQRVTPKGDYMVPYHCKAFVGREYNIVVLGIIGNS